MSRVAREIRVILFPADRQFWVPQSRRIHVSHPGLDGRYTVRALPAGEYRLAGLTDPEPGRHSDPDLLSQLQLGAAEKKIQDVRVR